METLHAIPKAAAAFTTTGEAAPKYGGLRLPQVRVLQVLSQAKGPLTRGKISDRCGNKTQVVVGRAIGYSDPEKRVAFEQTSDGGFTASLLTLGYVREIPLDIDGIEETAIAMTDAGRRAFKALGKLSLPPLRD